MEKYLQKTGTALNDLGLLSKLKAIEALMKTEKEGERERQRQKEREMKLRKREGNFLAEEAKKTFWN